MSVQEKVPVLLLGLLVVACGATGGDADGTTTTSADSTTTTAAPPDSTTTSTIGDPEMPDQEAVTDAAKADLAERLGVLPEDVSVVQVRQVDWPDTALGCPEEGMAYSQVIVPGLQVLLQVAGRVFDYHAGSDGQAFLCPSDERDGGYDFVPPPGIDQQ